MILHRLPELEVFVSHEGVELEREGTRQALDANPLLHVGEIPRRGAVVSVQAADGMSRDCAINLDHVQTVSMARVGPLIATLSSRRMTEMRSALLFALGFDR